MKPKLPIITLCALALASCNNEPEIVLGEDALPAVAMAIIDKPIAEAEDYLVNINYARLESTVQRQDYYREYFRPEEILNLLAVDYQETLNTASYERLLFNTNRDNILWRVEGFQQFDSPKMALANFRAWVGLFDQFMTDSATWVAGISMFHSLDINDTATAISYYGGVKSEEYIQTDKEMGWAYASREDFYKALNSLTPKQYFQVSMMIEDANNKNLYMDYCTLEKYYAGYPSTSQKLIVTTDANRRISFSCLSHADSTD